MSFCMQIKKYEDIFILRKTQFYKTLEIFYYDPVQLWYLQQSNPHCVLEDMDSIEVGCPEISDILGLPIYM